LLAKEYGFKGYTTVKSQACAAGAIGIGDAFKLVKWGYADCLLAGGADFSCNIAGYYMMDL
jgi:3-oxoacyl-[acyl-carrier-protein] synthase II